MIEAWIAVRTATRMEVILDVAKAKKLGVRLATGAKPAARPYILVDASQRCICLPFNVVDFFRGGARWLAGRGSGGSALGSG